MPIPRLFLGDYFVRWHEDLLLGTGGDWQGWQARMPLKSEFDKMSLTESLATEARLLKLARNRGGE